MDIEMKETSCGKYSTLATHAGKVFGIELLLRTILEKLDKKELLRVRMTNITWNQKSTEILLKRKSFEIFFGSTENCQPKLQLMSCTLDKSWKLNLSFPCSNFRFNIRNLYSTQLQTFLSNYGSIVEACSIHFISRVPSHEQDTWPSLKTIGSLLFRHLTNLKTLHFEADENIVFEKEEDYFELLFHVPTTSGTNGRMLVLPKLEEIDFVCWRSPPSFILESILQVGVNIQKISLHSIQSAHFINVILQAEKEHLISFLGLNLYPELLQPIFSLGERRLGVKMIILVNLNGELLASETLMMEASKAICKLLRSTAHSLETFVAHPFFYYPPFPIPIMPKLGVLSLLSKRCRTVFPTPLFEISKTFPQLKFIGGKFQKCACISNAAFGNSFLGASYNDTVLSVNRIRIEIHPGNPCMLYLNKLFPNLADVDLGILSNIPEAFGALWSLFHLSRLSFVVVVLGEREINTGTNKRRQIDPDPELEVALTGISDELYLELLHNVDSVDLTTVCVPRTNRSMLNAQSLKMMCITIVDDCKEERILGTRSVLTHITGHFAFRMCPLVQVKIKLFARNRCNFEQLRENTLDVEPFVKEVSEITYDPVNKDESTCQG